MRAKETKVRRVGLGALALGLAVAVGACGEREATQITAFTTATVERGDLRIVAEATGAIEPVRQVEVKSKASGEIVALYADVGDEVEPGTLLAEIDPRDVRNRYDQVKADVEVTRESHSISERQLRRQEELHANGVITEQELENARLSFANAEASLIRAEANMELAELQLNDVTIRAPLSGTVLTRSVEEGTVIQSASGSVSGGSVLFTMASLDAMQVRTLVDETDMGSLTTGMPATITVEAYPDQEFAGRVERIEPQAVVQQNVTMFPVIVTMDNRSGLLKPGMNSEVEILIDEADDVLLVPNNAIVNTDDVEPASMVLGLDVDNMDFSEFRTAGRFGGGMPGMGAPEGAEGNGEDPEASGAARGGEGRGRAGRGGGEGRVRDLSPDSLRALAQSMRERRGGDDAGPERRARRVVVFVVTGPNTKPEPKMVEIGLNDWDRTQVLTGLEEGDQVAIVGAAQLQAQQEEWMNRRRQRRGNDGPFGR